jgi:hypothetical protein
MMDGITPTRNIQRHASRPHHFVASAPPSPPANQASERSATKMPSTMAICCGEAGRPRRFAGASSEI